MSRANSKVGLNVLNTAIQYSLASGWMGVRPQVEKYAQRLVAQVMHRATSVRRSVSLPSLWTKDLVTQGLAVTRITRGPYLSILEGSNASASSLTYSRSHLRCSRACTEDLARLCILGTPDLSQWGCQQMGIPFQNMFRSPSKPFPLHNRRHLPCLKVGTQLHGLGVCMLVE